MKKNLFTRMIALLLAAAFLPSYALADDWDLDAGSVSVNASDSGQTVTQGNTSKADSAPVITSNSNSTTNTVTISADASQTANVTI